MGKTMIDKQETLEKVIETMFNSQSFAEKKFYDYLLEHGTALKTKKILVNINHFNNNKYVNKKVLKKKAVCLSADGQKDVFVEDFFMTVDIEKMAKRLEAEDYERCEVKPAISREIVIKIIGDKPITPETNKKEFYALFKSTIIHHEEDSYIIHKIQYALMRCERLLDTKDTYLCTSIRLALITGYPSDQTLIVDIPEIYHICELIQK